MEAICVKLNDVVKPGVLITPSELLSHDQARLLKGNPSPTSATFIPKVKGKRAGCSCAGCFLNPEVVSDLVAPPRVVADFRLILAQVSWFNPLRLGHSHCKLELENKHQWFKLTEQQTWSQIISFYTEQWYRSAHSAFTSRDLTLYTMYVVILWKGLFRLLEAN